MNQRLGVALLLAIGFLLAVAITQGREVLGAASAGLPVNGTPLSLPLVMKGQRTVLPSATPTNVLPTMTLAVSPVGTSPGTTATTVPPTPTGTVSRTVTATRTPTHTPTSTPIGTPPTPQAITLFLPYELRGEVYLTANPSIAVDSQGGIHVAHESFQWFSDDPEPVYYAHCAGACDSRDDFTAIELEIGDGSASYVNLALDAQGHPRLLWQVEGGFRFAECNVMPCTTRDRWTISPQVIGRLAGTTEGSNRMLALDAADRPRFVFTDATSGEHSGTYYMFCDSNCTEAAHWEPVKILSIQVEEPSLSITSDGLPRLAFRRDAEVDARLGYIECSTDCQVAANWYAFLFASPIDASRSSFSLRLTSGGDTRILLYTGAVEEEGEWELEQVYYLSCGEECGLSGNGWDISRLPNLTGATSKDVALALDSQNAPRIAYNGGNGVQSAMRYAWCNESCESNGANWQTMLVDTVDELVDAPLATCENPAWTFGYQVSLALDTDGDPRLVYDARTSCGESWSRFARLRQP